MTRSRALAAAQTLPIRGDVAANLAEHVRLAEARLEVGAGTPLDVQRAQVQHGQAEVQLVQARNTADIAAITLGQYLGTPLDPSVALTSTFEIFQPAWSAQQLVEMALGTNPSLKAAEANAAAARTSVKSARTQYLPSLGFNMGINGWVSQAGDISGLVNQQVFGLGQQYSQCQTNNQLMALIGRPPTNCAAFDPNDPAVVAGIPMEPGVESLSAAVDHATAQVALAAGDAEEALRSARSSFRRAPGPGGRPATPLLRRRAGRSATPPTSSPSGTPGSRSRAGTGAARSRRR